MEEFELYRFNHHDGTSKDWAIRDNRNGTFTTRWGKTGPRLTGTAIKLSRHTGRDRRYPDCRDAPKPRHPWSLGSGGPCRNDEFFPDLMAVRLTGGKISGVKFGVLWNSRIRIPHLA